MSVEATLIGWFNIKLKSTSSESFVPDIKSVCVTLVKSGQGALDESVHYLAHDGRVYHVLESEGVPLKHVDISSYDNKVFCLKKDDEVFKVTYEEVREFLRGNPKSAGEVFMPCDINGRDMDSLMYVNLDATWMLVNTGTVDDIDMSLFHIDDGLSESFRQLIMDQAHASCIVFWTDGVISTPSLRDMRSFLGEDGNLDRLVGIFQSPNKPNQRKRVRDDQDDQDEDREIESSEYELDSEYDLDEESDD